MENKNTIQESNFYALEEKLIWESTLFPSSFNTLVFNYNRRYIEIFERVMKSRYQTFKYALSISEGKMKIDVLETKLDNRFKIWYI